MTEILFVIYIFKLLCNNCLITSPSVGNYFNTNIRNKHEAEVIARVGKSSVIVYSKGEEIEQETQKSQEA